MTELEQKVADLQAQKEAMEADPEGIDTNAYNLIVNQLSEAQDELNQQNEKAQRDQQQQSIIESAVDVLPSLFDAIFPKDSFEQELGINNYAAMQQSFNMIVRAYTSEQIGNAAQAYEATIAQKDDKIKLLNNQSLEVQQKMDAANKQLEDLGKQFQGEIDAHDKTTSELAQVRDQLKAAQNECASKDETIAELQNKLNAAQQPKSEPSANLQDVIAQVKAKSAMAADDWVARWNARQENDAAKVQVPEVPGAAPATFPDSGATSQTDHNGDTEASSAEVQPPSLTEETFPVAPGLEMADQQQGVQPAGATVEERLSALESRVAALENAKGSVAA